jgi:anti-sigma regulatory factor (Ser/Thr protein kinase)
MPRATHSLDESYDADPESVGRARADLARFAAGAGASSVQVDDVRLAVSEAVTNAVQHGYRGSPGRVQIAAGATDRELWIIVCDSGSGMQLSTDRPGLGLGLGLIAQVTDHMTIVPRPAGGTELRMCFDLPTGASDAVAGADATTTMVAFASPSLT